MLFLSLFIIFELYKTVESGFLRQIYSHTKYLNTSCKIDFTYSTYFSY